MDNKLSKQTTSEKLCSTSKTTPTLFKKKEGHFEVSIYKGQLTEKGIAENFAIAKASFPELENVYFKILQEMVKDSNFSDERLKDAVYHVVKTCVYPRPTVANFLSYDKNIKVYDYNQYLKLVDEIGIKTEDLYKSVRFIGAKKPAWVSVNDIEKYNLELWNK